MQKANTDARPGKKWVNAHTGGQKKHKEAIFFLAGREKNAPGADFSDKEVEAVKIIAHALENANSRKLDELIATEILKEICHDKQKND